MNKSPSAVPEGTGDRRGRSHERSGLCHNQAEMEFARRSFATYFLGLMA
jgi:hypothetical protein